MTSTYTLQLYQPKSADRPNRPLIVPPPGVPRSLPEAGRLLNHALLLAEIWGQPTEPVLETIPSDKEVPEGTLQAYDVEDVALLLGFVSLLVTQLALALDAQGQPVGEAGQRLSDSPLIEQMPDGQLAFKHHHLPLETLLEGLALFAGMLEFAQEQQQWLQVV